MVGGNLILTYQNIIKAGNMWETLYLTNLFPPLLVYLSRIITQQKRTSVNDSKNSSRSSRQSESENKEDGNREEYL